MMGLARVWDVNTGREIVALFGHEPYPDAHVAHKHLSGIQVWSATFSPDDQRIVTTGRDGTARIWQRRRPEYWWGVAWLPEFWLALVLALSMLWSIRRDRREVAVTSA